MNISFTTMSMGELANRLGLSNDKIVGKKVEEVFPHNSEFYMKKYEAAWTGEKVQYEGCIGGINYWVTLRPIIKDGRVVELVGSSVDISVLRESETKLNLIAENISDLLVMCDVDGVIQYVSPSLYRTLGYQELEIIGLTGLKRIHPADRQAVVTQWAAGVREKKIMNLQFRFRVNEPVESYLELEGRGVPILNAEHEMKGIAIVARDVTERNNTERLLMQTEKLSIAGELAAGIAHEIRNPLTSLKGFLQLSREKRAWNDKYIRVMFDEIDRIEMILNELLMLAKPQLHKKGWVDLQTVVSDVITLFQPQAIMSDIQLIEKDMHSAWVYGDPHQLKQVFINFLKNALESMKTSGTVTLTMGECDRFHSVKITDEGCGISEDMLRKIGEPFYSTKEKGTGLGMMVSRKIIESHGGILKIKSQVDIGTVVEVCFPKSVEA